MNTHFDIIKSLSKFDPKALAMVAHSLETRANSVIAVRPVPPINVVMTDVYELLASVVDMAHEISLDELEECQMEERIIREANERFFAAK